MSSVKLISVQDGDTVTLEWHPPHNVWHRFRMADIEAPHRNEAHFITAREQLRELLKAGSLSIELSKQEHIRLVSFNRPCAYIWSGTTCLNVAMCRFGLCVAWTPRQWGQHAHECTHATYLAAQERLGIWGEPCHRLRDLAVLAPQDPTAASP